ncbi:hypothetical protein GW793_00100 [bacterium]|uniref:HAD family hydrolase n=2 Tax=Katanobacteria TaxID=422282 RepID=A0A2M7X258_UNCKA|nr:hypothetical protein [bacterium]PIP56108.1 MAG: hypothetical protein COX05_04785 [candidate division WWE3 bacterium CG22_combo_CG10-13_8_21_14_all_39_12]PJA40218.1 MAG: hypothetical protein CO179_02965 [candidate division WWE3 bacterium CG_4_9_14_3_um_filter_39_7]
MIRHELRLCPEVKDVLELLSKQYTLGLYSQGFSFIQKLKLKITGINQFFSPTDTYISFNKRGLLALIPNPQSTVIVDNRADMLEPALALNIHTIWINRENKQKHPTLPTIFSFTELPLMLENLTR